MCRCQLNSPTNCVVCISTPRQADSAGGGVGGDGATKPILDDTRKESGDCNEAACCGFLEVEDLEDVIGQSCCSKNKTKGDSSDGACSKTNESRNSSTAADASALATDDTTSGDGGCSGGGGDLSPSVDDGRGAWSGTGHRTPPRTSRSPAGSPGLTPLRGRSRRGWWRRRRDKYPTAN